MFVQFFLTICALIVYLWFEKRNEELPPGPLRLPILGSVIQLFRANAHHPHLALAKLSAEYGEIMTIGFGMQTAVVVSSYKIMKNVFQRMTNNSHRFEFPFVFDRSYGKNLGLNWSKGQVWIDVKRFVVKVFKECGYGNSYIMDQSLTDSANQLIDDIKMEIFSADGSYFVDSRKFAVHALNVLWAIVGGYKFEPNDVLLKRNMDLLDKIIQIASLRNPYNLFPFLKDWFPNQLHYPEHLDTHRDLHKYTNALINDVKKKRSQRFNFEATSFIEVFLDKIEMHHGDPDTIFTLEQLEMIINDLFLDGAETTGTVLNWSILYLVQNPNIQSKLRRKIFNKIENYSTDILHAGELKQIPYLKAFFLETLRMANVGPIPPPRLAMLDVKIKNYLIPKGTMLLYNLHPMLKDINYWKDPENFKPERYLNECGGVDQELSERVMSVFGLGSRTCIGKSLAMETFFIFLAKCLMNFEFHSIPGQEPSAENPLAGMVLTPRKYCIKITTAEM